MESRFASEAVAPAHPRDGLGGMGETSHGKCTLAMLDLPCCPPILTSCFRSATRRH